VQRGFWWSHVLWILCPKYEKTKFDAIKDFARFPELRFLNTWHLLPPIALAVVLFVAGGFSMLLWGFFLSTTLLWHGTFTINSLSHVFGKRRYKTTDTSRNNWLLALLTCGEGWHNNHHYHQNTANAGWFWWEIDLSFYALKALEKAGLVWDLRMPSEAVRFAHLKYSEAERLALQDPERAIRLRAAAGKGPASAPVTGVPSAATNVLSKPAERMREALAAATETLQQPAPAEQ
jgi:stearoyl-CoA desaturase (delta-9 desaturase)